MLDCGFISIKHKGSFAKVARLTGIGSVDLGSDLNGPLDLDRTAEEARESARGSAGGLARLQTGIWLVERIGSSARSWAEPVAAHGRRR